MFVFLKCLRIKNLNTKLSFMSRVGPSSMSFCFVYNMAFDFSFPCMRWNSTRRDDVWSWLFKHLFVGCQPFTPTNLPEKHVNESNSCFACVNTLQHELRPLAHVACLCRWSYLLGMKFCHPFGHHCVHIFVFYELIGVYCMAWEKSKLGK